MGMDWRGRGRAPGLRGVGEGSPTSDPRSEAAAVARRTRAALAGLFGTRGETAQRRRMGLPGQVAQLQQRLRALALAGVEQPVFERLIRDLELAVGRAGLDFPPIGLLFGDMLVIVERNGGQPFVQRRWVGWSEGTFQRWALDGQTVGAGYRAYPVYRGWFQGAPKPSVDPRYGRVGNYFAQAL